MSDPDALLEPKPRKSEPRELLRWRVASSLFELLYRNRALYWLASTIPFAGQWRRWQRLVIPRLGATSQDVLEVGCGIGTLQTDLNAAGYTCAAVDRSPQMVAATRARLRRHGFTAAAEDVTQGDVRDLPFPDASFDAVVSTFPTDYIADPRSLREIARVLRPGGRLIVVLSATLLPTSALLLPFVAIQTMVYGRAPRREDERVATAAARPFLALLNRCGFAPRFEAVRGPFWVAHLYVAEKPIS
ncbi:MAG TPA: class I SAM-dependent methyltransferase [Ktedonobacterales bacterium]